MRIFATVVVLSGCGSFVRGDVLAGPMYDKCVRAETSKDRSAGREIDEKGIDKYCVSKARDQARARMEEGTSTTYCDDSFGSIVCKTTQN